MIRDFTFYTPTKVVFGKNAEEKVGALVKEQGCRKVMVHYGTGSVVRSGLLDRVLASLDAEGIPYVTFGGAVPNPRLSKAKEGIALAKAEGVDFLLGVGGGSAVDSAKCIAYGIANPDEDVWSFYTKTKKPEKCAPVGVVMTLAATGSEMSDSSVITNDELPVWEKRGAGSDLSRPRFAVLNPELTYTLPPYQTASGAVDIMMHTMERYFQAQTLTVTEGMCEALLRDMLEAAPKALADPTDYEARAEIMWCGAISHNNLMQLGGTRGDWSCHQLEHSLGALFDVAHGAGLGAVWPSWARYVYKEMPERFAKFATRVMGVPEKETAGETALAGIAAFEDFLHSLNMPANLTELGVDTSDETFRKLAENCSYGRTRTIGGGGIKALDADDMENIYRAAV